MEIVCLDLEGVLIPEMWLEVAERTGLEALRLTTRDVEDYDELMQHRIRVLAENRISLADLQTVTATVSPLSGATEFLQALRQRYQVAILSDTFVQFVSEIMKQLGYPFLLCNTLEVDATGMIAGYRMRQHNGKESAVQLFKKMNTTVRAAGDSFNDIAMLRAADRSVLFCPSETVRAAHPDLPVAYTYEELTAMLSPES